MDVVRDKLTKDITYGNEPNLAIGFRFRDNGFKGGAVDEFRVYNRALTAPEAAQLAGGVALRDSRSPGGPALVFASAVWDGFLRRMAASGTLADQAESPGSAAV